MSTTAHRITLNINAGALINVRLDNVPSMASISAADAQTWYPHQMHDTELLTKVRKHRH